MLIRLLTITAIAVLTVRPIEAQERRPVPDRYNVELFDTLPRRVQPGQTVYVTDTRTQEIEGRLIRVSQDTVTVLVQGAEREFPRGDVQKIARRGDSLGNGILIGMGAAAGLALVGTLADDSSHPNDHALVIGGTVFVAAIGAGIGALIDRAIKGKTVVYRAKPVTVTATPLIQPRGAGVSVGLRF